MNSIPFSLASFPTLIVPTVSKNGLWLTRLFQEGESVPGTTDGILLMGILIVLIIVLPIVWTRRKWMR
jgi:hypothetical protein